MLHEHAALHARRSGGSSISRASGDHREDPDAVEGESAALLLAVESGAAVDAQYEGNLQAAPVGELVPLAKSSAKAPSKILFLDGVRGLAAIFVVTQHSGFMGDINLGACAVDIFFVLSSFLLTWLFFKKSEQLVVQKASYRKWLFTLADYFSKRFFRVYPLFAAVAIALWLMPFESKQRYFLINERDHFDLFKVLTFEFPYRYHVFWTLPLEIAYYFLIPVIVLITIGFGRGWWIPSIPLLVWIVDKGLYGYRTSHYPLAPHMPTFLSGSLAPIVFVKIDAALKRREYKFSEWQKLVVWGVECCVLGVLLSVCFQGLFFDWIHANPAPQAIGFPYVSALVTILIVIEMVLPSWLSGVFEWNVLRYWGKISFSVYLLHSFVIYNDKVRSQTNYYDKLFSVFFLVALLATASYHAIEYPSQLLSLKISKALAQPVDGATGDINLGECAVDIFFVLSSFLLTWLFYKKSEQLLAQKANLRKWFFMLVDYFSKRFFRVYPLFAIVATVVWMLPNESKQRYFLLSKPEEYDLYKVLTFEFEHRYHVFWTLPLEIAYYFLIPLIVLIAIRLGQGWWVPCGPLFYWIGIEGWTELRGDHQPLRPHLSTFVCGSLAAILYVKIDAAIKR
ncbi:Acyltransferase family, partial [Globisporangium polare]